MKHVNDEFWQSFGPALQRAAKADGNPDFFMFGEVALDSSDAGTKGLHVPLHDARQDAGDPRLPASRPPRSTLPARARATSSSPSSSRTTTGTPTATPTSELPTFLGNHDMGRIGCFLKTDNPAAGDEELLARDELAHAALPLPRAAGRLLRRRAGASPAPEATSSPGRRCSPARSRSTRPTTRSAPTAPAATTTS